MVRHWGPSPKGGRRAMGRRWRPPTCSSGVAAASAATGTNFAAAMSSRVSLRGLGRSKLSWWSVAYTRGPAAKVT